jgi:hypothetical protein
MNGAGSVKAGFSVPTGRELTLYEEGCGRDVGQEYFPAKGI